MILLVTRTARRRGDDGEAFMTSLLSEGKAARYFELAVLTTVVAGALLYWRASAGLQLGWITSPSGIGFSIGSIAAVVSLAWGAALVGPSGKRAAQIQADVTAAGGATTRAQATEMDGIRRRLNTFAMIDLILLGVAVVCMATARSW